MNLVAKSYTRYPEFTAPSIKSFTTTFAVSRPSFNVLKMTPTGPVLTQPQQ